MPCMFGLCKLERGERDRERNAEERSKEKGREVGERAAWNEEKKEKEEGMGGIARKRNVK